MKTIEADTPVEGWLRACDYLIERPNWRAYNIILEIRHPLLLPRPDRVVHDALDVFLSAHGGLPISTVANTIFPALLYMRHGADGIYDRYLENIYPRIRRHPNFSWGTYFHRMIWRQDHEGSVVNPLRDLISKLTNQLAQHAPNRAVYELGVDDVFLDIPIYEPGRDRNRPLGGPCLSHLSFKLDDSGKLMLTAFYRSHYYIQRALGNLIGLSHLLNFVSEQVGIDHSLLLCISSMGQLDTKSGHWGKGDVRELLSHFHTARVGAVG